MWKQYHNICGLMMLYLHWSLTGISAGQYYQLILAYHTYIFVVSIWRPIFTVL